MNHRQPTKKRRAISFIVDTVTASQALEELQKNGVPINEIPLIPMRITDEGFIHPGNRVLPYDIPPSTHKILELEGEDDAAIPKDSKYSQADRTFGKEMPEGTLFWIRGEWRTPPEL